ncbi:MAG: DUF5916 domain-containing protein, partial [Ferruginibacter sp.]
RPNFGESEESNSLTEVKIMYDDEAIYFGGFNHEQNKSSISTELVGRDKPGINDYVGIVFDTYQDKINGTGFFVTALGEQFDVKYSLGREDGSWSTVYQTATNITDSGWSFEMRIPYSALRFSKYNIQDWGINIFRKRAKTGQQFTWSPLNPEKFGLMNQAGIWKGIENIKSPLRLSFSPYFSASIDQSPLNSGGKVVSKTVNGGLDVKYGISKSFTLDMTLIPDFGQVQSDNLVLNLSPFEIRYNEYRPFFTEGTELFNKGNLFYSRRVGGAPVNGGRVYGELGKKSQLLKNPVETKLINATKLSGRTSNGLGVGIFNAITKPQFSEFVDSNNLDYKIETNPWTNYNIVVLDKTLKNNSSVSLVNTNVLRSGSTYDANVTAALFDFYDKKVNWNVWGKAAHSRLTGQPFAKAYGGNNYEFNFGKFKGPFNFEMHHYLADDKYEQNDLGYFNNNNYSNTSGNAWYKLSKPKGFYNSLFFNLGATYSMRYKPYQFQSFSMYTNARAQLKSLWSLGLFGNFTPEQQDFYEPRTAGKKFKTPGSWRLGAFVSTNSAKKYAAEINFSRRPSAKYKAFADELSLGNRYRFNDRLSAEMGTFIGNTKNNAGFAYRDTAIANTVYFGLRDRYTVENTFGLKYNFNTKMGITLRNRHYWSKVKYNHFFKLKDDGYLLEINSTQVQANPDNNVNYFNVDMIYTWEFALGSFINLTWKNAGFTYNKNTQDKYYNNLTETIDSPHQNSLSIKVIYYLDYLVLKNRKK